MSEYGWRDNKLDAQDVSASRAVLLTSATGSVEGYLYVGSAGSLRFSSTLPNSDHDDKGTHVATVA